MESWGRGINGEKGIYIKRVWMSFAFFQYYFLLRQSMDGHLRLKNVRTMQEDGGGIGGSGVHFPTRPEKYLADLRSRANSQWYSSIYEDRRPKIENIERSDGKKST